MSATGQQWYELELGDAVHVNPAAHAAWVHPSGASLALLWEGVEGHPGIGCWVWELTIESGATRSLCYSEPVKAPIEWAEKTIAERSKVN